jgi:hypothetical protein
MFGRLAETLVVGTEAAMSVLPRPTIDQHNIRDFNLIGNGVEASSRHPDSKSTRQTLLAPIPFIL